MKINVEDSIRGLWLATSYEGYLQRWFPRLRSDNGNFIPLSPGINVLYGRNGAGKTQIIQAIAHAAEFKMSAYEGFILHNPQISEITSSYPEEKYEIGNYEKTYGILEISVEQLLARYQAIDTGDRDLGWTNGFDPNEIPEDKEYLVLSILTEFLESKNALLTRSPVKEDPSADDPNRMNIPEFIQLVPMLFPSDSAPITRMHAKDIHNSYLDFVEKFEEQFTAGSDPDLSVDENNEAYFAEGELKGRAFNEWVSSWAWSPLINLRNLGYNDGDYSFVDNGGKGNLFKSDVMPIYLPAAFSYDNRKEYEEFKSRTEYRVSLTLTKEADLPSMPNLFSMKRQEDSLSDITFDDIGYRNKEYGSSTVDQPDEYEKLLREYLPLLKAKLKFLPNFRSLDILKSEYEPNPQLVINNNVRVSRGSGAERRWLNLAKESIRIPTQWIVIDEPESGLHRAAEAELAQALSSTSWNKGSIVVVATHSPEFLDLPNAHVNHVDGGKVRELTEIDREDLVALGLRPGDLLGQIRTFLLVEGEHEKVIFENIFGSELRRAGCKIIVARGAKNMKDVFESQMIFNFSDATIVSLLDNIDALDVNAIWSEAKKMAETGKLIEAGQYIRSSLPGKNHSENTFLSQFLTLALANGQHERIEVWGLTKADIVLYFEPSDFGIKRTWEELLSTHTSTDPSFKEWATKKYGADFTVSAIDRASRNILSAPEEFGSLMLRISELSSRSLE
jgi:ABC-type branched-subunit amino acid transport system ATPase component